ncbi:uncharacterized protein LOC112087977 [Eutrema salsugineum]|uniref:uncharacterized protein LOC112087977 n=1 Tax=Eutrema salsugineum TaxID=72664 RepID=UPI000CED665C|nr:uncharacterized protein LOC112087977 [Eutrema salsugineum]
MTCKFLASLQADFYREIGPAQLEDGFGTIAFKIGQERYEMTFRDISECFGFTVEGRTCAKRLIYYGTDLDQLWWAIGSGDYSAGVTKAACIRSPVLMMVHKIIAHTFFGKTEYSTVYDEELMLIGEGLKPLMPKFSSGMTFNGDPHKPTMAALLVKKLLSIRKSAHDTKIKAPSMRLGGLITPILLRAGVQMNDKPISFKLMDALHLAKTTFLEGSVGDSFAYNLSIDKKVKVRVLLPNTSLTSLSEQRNIRFHVTKDQHYNPEINPPIKTIRKLGKLKAPVTDADGDQEPVQEEPLLPDPVYGSHRYFFDSYDGQMPNEATVAAHYRTKSLQRWNKWQENNTKKLVETVKMLGSTVKSMRAKIKKLSAKLEKFQRGEVGESSHNGEMLRICGPEDHSSPESEEDEIRAKRDAMRSPSHQSSNPSYSMGSPPPSLSP